MKSGPFDEQEATRLRQLVKRHGEDAEAWEAIAPSLPGRTPLACLQEYTREGRAEEARTREKERRIGNLCFTDEDVNRVRQLVLKHGQSWKKLVDPAADNVRVAKAPTVDQWRGRGGEEGEVE